MDMPTTNVELYRYVEDNYLVNVKRLLLQLHPLHTFFTVGALKTAPRDQSEQQAWHTDYRQETIHQLPAHLLPFSVIVTMRDECVFVYIDAMTGCKVELIVAPFSFVRFMGYVVHCGGRNRQDHVVYRLFMYCAVSLEHIPNNALFHSNIRQHCECGGCF